MAKRALEVLEPESKSLAGHSLGHLCPQPTDQNSSLVPASHLIVLVSGMGEELDVGGYEKYPPLSVRNL